MEFGVLGPLRIRVNGEWVQLAGPKQRTVLAVLLVNANRVVPFDQLLEEVWGDKQPAAGIRTLRYQVSKLRDSLDPGRPRGDESVLRTEGGGYVLRVEQGDVDVHRFELLATDGAKAFATRRFPQARAQMHEALALWRGDAFDDFRYESFAQGEIARLEEERLRCLETRIAADLELGQHREVVAELRELTTRYPFREALWAHLMVALYRTGERAEAVRAYESARRVLGEELGVEPNTALQRLEQQIRLHDLPFQRPSVREPARRGNLPARIRALVGRDDDARIVRELIERHRLVTLTGFGGVGKTSLALEVARNAEPANPDGVWLVQLASVPDPSYVVGAFGSALGVHQDGSRGALEATVDQLAGQELMLVVDNCEHLASEVGRVIAGLLAGCPRIRVLATSREPLRIDGEQVWPVPPLALPDEAAEVSPDVAVAADAVRLLVERARQADPSFALNDGNVQEVVSLCRRLDGIPLALELAAARLRLLTPHEVLQRLEDRFALLTAERPRDDRHRSLAAAIEWSYNLLEEPERVLFRRLGVFTGGFTLAGVEAVASGEVIADGEVVDRLGRLVDASLVTVSAGERRRFGMLESVHEYAKSLLAGSAEERVVRARHADHLIALLPDMPGMPEFDMRAFADAERTLAVELDNFRSALAWAVGEREGRRALALADWMALEDARYDELLYWLPKALQVSKSSGTAERVRVLAGLAHQLAFSPRRDQAPPVLEQLKLLTSRLGDDVLSSLAAFAEASYLEAESRPVESLQAYEPYAAKLPDAAGPFKSMVLANIAFGAITVGRFEDASRWIAEHDRLGQRLGQQRMRLSAAINLGTLAHYRGDLQAARQILFHCLGGLRELNVPWILPAPLDQLAQVSLESGALQEAASFAHQLIAVSQGLVRTGAMADGHVLLARAELGGGGIGPSVGACSEALRLALQVDDIQALTRLAATVAQVAAARGDAVAATELHATADTMNREIGTVLPKHRERELVREQQALRRALGVQAFGSAWQRGTLRRRPQLGHVIGRVLDSMEA